MPIRLLRHLLSALVLAFFAAGATQATEPPAWFDATGRPRPEAAQAVEVLAAAAEHGLRPADYDTAELRERLAAARAAPLAEPARQQLDAALTAALLRYLDDLRAGRIDPRSIGARFEPSRHAQVDSATVLQGALASGRFAAALREAEPRLPMYAALKQALAQYRSFGEHPAWHAPLPPLPGGKLAEGQAYAGLDTLAARLRLLGDLPAGSAPAERFDGPLVQALKSFQQRHGLKDDGVLGRETLRQLEVTPAARARQIELSMERLRWTPFLQGDRMIVVNLPEFTLRAYEVKDGRIDVRLTMKVIVGKALNTRTPLFDEDMRFIEFSPYWNVPPSIARGELVPRLRRDPGHFHDQGFEFVTGSGEVVRSLAPSHLDAVLSGAWRIRQRPGARNALGDIKFVFPNNSNIYLHHTPSVGLFERDRRDLSHGCIRVEEPVALAQFVLRDEPQWTEARIREAMEQGSSSTHKLSRPLPVLIAYSTVVARGGRTFFYADLYGHDKLLDQALQRRPRETPGLHLSEGSSK